jgi:N-acetyl sugar amidotransferase
VTFDAQGVCSVCRAVEFKKDHVDWTDRKAQLVDLIESYRGKYAYDCIIPFSGGKDSTFTAWYLIKHFKIKPLIVCFDHGFFRPTLLANTERALRRMGADFLKFRANFKVVKRLMREALIRKGDFCWHCHTGVFSFPMQMAVKFQVPLVFWGEPNSEYNAFFKMDEQELVDEKRFNRFVNLGITAEDMIGMIKGDTDLSIRDLAPFQYPPREDLRKLGYRSVCLGTYIPWDVKKQTAIIADELGWQEEDVEGVPRQYGYEKIECQVQGVRDYLKFIKRGMGRTNHLACIDIRNKRLTRDEGLRLVEEYDGRRPASLDLFLDILDMTEEEFNDIAQQHCVWPHRHDPSTVKPGAPLWDQEQWERG